MQSPDSGSIQFGADIETGYYAPGPASDYKSYQNCTDEVWDRYPSISIRITLRIGRIFYFFGR